MLKLGFNLMDVMKEIVSKSTFCYFTIALCILVVCTGTTEGAIKRCFVCRSRGELGSCKDPFKYGNFSSLDEVKGVKADPCPSGWCSKILEGGANQFKDEEYGAATSRSCLQRGPTDNEERCAMTTLGQNPAQVLMCLCQGDLCNGSTSTLPPSLLFLLPGLTVLYLYSRILLK